MSDSELRPLLTRRLRRDQLIALDAVAAVGYTFMLLLLVAGQARPEAGGSAVPVWAACLIVAGMGLPLAVRRLWPVPVFCAVLAVSLPATVLDVARDSFVAAAFALYLVALTAPRRRWVPTSAIAALSAVGALVGSVVGTSAWWGDEAGLVLSGVTVLGGTWTAGRVLRERRASAARAAERLADHAVTEERLRIARELHDIVAHSMSLIAVKAGIANHVADARPLETRDALRVIETTSRGALVDLRRMLGVLRSGTDAGTGGTGGVVGPAAEPPSAELGPAPGPACLPELAGRAAMTGVRVDLDLRGVERLPEGVGLSVYRIVQEALTNVVKHAAPARCRVTVEADGREVRIEVTDDGPGLHPPAFGPAGQPGHGLIGMRERVMLYGGSFTAGPRPEGGFGVCARMPYGPAAGGPT